MHVEHMIAEKWKENEYDKEDLFVGEQIMEEKQQKIYFQDVIATDERNLKIFSKGQQKEKELLIEYIQNWKKFLQEEDIFEIGILSKDSLLVSSTLYNAEAWTKNELELLESIGRMFLLKLPEKERQKKFYTRKWDLIRERRFEVENGKLKLTRY